MHIRSRSRGLSARFKKSSKRVRRLIPIEQLEIRTLLSGDILFAGNWAITEFTPAGVAVRRLTLPVITLETPIIRDVAMDDQGHVDIVNSMGPQLQAYDPATNVWTNAPSVSGWSIAAATGTAIGAYGNLATSGNYVFATDNPTTTDTTQGVIEFDRSNGYAATEFDTRVSPNDVTIGQDGRLYVAIPGVPPSTTSGGTPVTVQVFTLDDPTAPVLDHTLTLAGTTSFGAASIAVDAAGTIYAVGAGGQLAKFDPTGASLATLATTAKGATDLTLGSDGTLLIATGFSVYSTDTSFSQISSFAVPQSSSGSVAFGTLASGLPNTPATFNANLTPADGATVPAGSSFSTSGTFTDPDATDLHTITIDWGDGSTPSVVSPYQPNNSFTAYHTYPSNASGTYQQAYTVTYDLFDGTAHTTLQRTLIATSPTVSFGSLPAAYEGQPFALTPTVSPAGTYTYSWSVSDAGGAGGAGNVIASGATPTISFTPQDNGAYQLAFTATTADGHSASGTTLLPVYNLAPTVMLPLLPAITEGQTLTATASATDPSPLDTAAGFTFAWRINDATGTTVAQGTTANVAFTPSTAGRYALTASATDKDGGTTKITQWFTVMAIPPMLSVSGPDSVDEGAPYTLALGASGLMAGTISAWHVDWGDGAVDTLPGNASSATHVYTDGPSDHTVVVSATDPDGTYVAPGFAGGATQVDTVPAAEGADESPGPGGTFFAAGLVNTYGAFAVTRYTADGAVDPTFGSGGSAAAPMVNEATLAAVAAAPDGGAYAIGDWWTGSNRCLLVAAYAPGGQLRAYMTSTTYAGGTAAAVTPDGKLLVVSGPNVLRFNADLSLDTTFGTGGAAPLGVAAYWGDMALTPDGKIVVAATVAGGNYNSQVVAVRLNGNGAIDTSFGGGTGRTYIDVPGDYDEAAGVAVGPDGSVLVTARSEVAFTNPSNYSAALLTPAGALNPGFGSGGVMFAAVNANNFDPGAAAAFLPDGRFVLGYGTATPGQFVIAQFNSDGSPDASFGPSGTGSITTTVPTSGSLLEPTAACVTADGQVRMLINAPYGFDHYFATYSFGNTVIHVDNVAPTASFAPAPATISEQQSLTLTASATDPSPVDTAAGFTFEWVATKNGAPFATGAGPAFTLTPDDQGTYTVTLTATDKDGATSATFSQTIVAVNEPPTAVFSGSTVPEGSAGTVAFSNQADASADMAAGFTYSYDFDNNGTWDLTTTSPVATLPASLTADGPATRTVRGRITDKDGASTVYAAVVNVTNVAPTPTIVGPSVVKKNANTKFTFTATDPSAADLAAGFTYAIDWNGDGNPDEIVKGGKSLSLSYKFKTAGIQTIHVWVTDKDGGTTEASWTFKVN